MSVCPARLPATGTKVIVRSFLRPWLKALAWHEAELKRDSQFRAEGEREILQEGTVDFPGLVGDRHTLREDTHPGTEITLMNARVVDLVADGDRERWPLAGDQLYVDFDLRQENLPPGTRLRSARRRSK